jgi:hypothetical protein
MIYGMVLEHTMLLFSLAEVRHGIPCEDDFSESLDFRVKGAGPPYWAQGCRKEEKDLALKFRSGHG